MEDFLEDAVRNHALDRMEAEIFQDELIDQGLSNNPDDWDSGRIEIDADHITIEVFSGGETFSFQLDVPDFGAYEWEWMIDLADFIADFVDVEWDRYTNV